MLKANAELYSIDYSGSLIYGCNGYNEELSYSGSIPGCSNGHLFYDENQAFQFYVAESILFVIFAVFLLFFNFLRND